MDRAAGGTPRVPASCPPLTQSGRNSASFGRLGYRCEADRGDIVSQTPGEGESSVRPRCCVSPRRAQGSSALASLHGPGRGAARSRPRSGAYWAPTGPPLSPRSQEKAEDLSAKPLRLISQPASLSPENSNQNKIIITPTLFPPCPRELGRLASRGHRRRARRSRAEPSLFGTVPPSRRS